jgi:polysaccharide deacetylase family protein (PEP-CTERM system associated)
MSNGILLNALSVDVEGFVESNLQSFHIPEKYINQSQENYEIERNIDVLLEILRSHNVKGTFFCVGRIAKEIPDLVKRISAVGHEIGCHNFKHVRVFDTDRKEFKEKLGAAKKDLEDITGQKVCGFRAPDFSITEKSIWALDVLKELGFLYDSSIFPFGFHDIYGIKNAESHVHRLPNGLVEFPLSTIELCGKRIPFGGGGYFRLYPVWLTKFFIKAINNKEFPCMLYIHPYEIGPVIPKIKELSAYRKFRHYYHCRCGAKRFKMLLRTFRFLPIIEILKDRGVL